MRFLVYKLQRVFPDIIRRLSGRVQKSAVAAGLSYMPTANVRCVLARKREG